MYQNSLFSATPSAMPTSYPVTVSIETLPLREAIRQLTHNATSLTASDRSFAASLVASYNRYGSLTPRQAPHIYSLLKRATNPTTATPAPAVILGDFTAVIDLFKLARRKLKYPKVRLMLEDGTPVILAVAGERSAAPGTITVSGEGTYPNRAWYGRVQPSGQWEPARNVSPATQEALVSLLAQFGTHPNGTAAAYGRATNTCCFCRAELTDARSVSAGYGPVCADHYGLTQQWKSAAHAAETADLFNGIAGGVRA